MLQQVSNFFGPTSTKEWQNQRIISPEGTVNFCYSNPPLHLPSCSPVSPITEISQPFWNFVPDFNHFYGKNIFTLHTTAISSVCQVILVTSHSPTVHLWEEHGSVLYTLPSVSQGSNLPLTFLPSFRPNKSSSFNLLRTSWGKWLMFCLLSLVGTTSEVRALGSASYSITKWIILYPSFSSDTIPAKQ